MPYFFGKKKNAPDTSKNLHIDGYCKIDGSLYTTKNVDVKGTINVPTVNVTDHINVLKENGIVIGDEDDKPLTIGQFIDNRIEEKLKDQTEEINKKIEIQTEEMKDEIINNVDQHVENQVTSQVDKTANDLRESMENQVEEVNSKIETLTRQNSTTNFENDDKDPGMSRDRLSTGENPNIKKDQTVVSPSSPVIESPSTLATESDVKSVAKDPSETNVKTDVEPAPAPEAPDETDTGGNAGAPRTSETNVKPVDEASAEAGTGGNAEAPVKASDNVGGKRMGRKTKKRKTKKTKVRKIKKGSKKTKVKRNTRKSKKGRK